MYAKPMISIDYQEYIDLQNYKRSEKLIEPYQFIAGVMLQNSVNNYTMSKTELQRYIKRYIKDNLGIEVDIKDNGFGIPPIVIIKTDIV